MAFNAEYKIVDYFTKKEVNSLQFDALGSAKALEISWNNSNTKVEFYPYNATWSEEEEWISYTYEEIAQRVGSTQKVFRLEITTTTNERRRVRTHDYKIVITDRVSNEKRDYIIEINQAAAKPLPNVELNTNWLFDRLILPYSATSTSTSEALQLSVVGYSGSVTYTVSKNQTGGIVRRISHAVSGVFGFLLSGANTLSQREELLTATATLADGRVLDKQIKIVQREYPQSDDILVVSSPFGSVLPYEGGEYTAVLELNKYIEALSVTKYGGFESEYNATVDGNVLTVNINPNLANTERVLTFALVGTHTHKTELQKRYITITQAAAPSIIDVAAYKDYYLEIQVDNNVENYPYTIKEGGTDNILYSGNAFVKDGYTQIYLNNILNKFTQPKLNTNTNVINNTNNYYRYDLYNGKNELIKIIYYNNNWNYENPITYSSDSGGLNMPISNNYIVGQIMPFSYLQGYKNNPITLNIQVNQKQPTQYITTLGSNTILYSGLIAKGDKVTFKADGVTVNEFSIDEECNTNLYAIIYRNILGGYDSVLFHNRTTQTDTIKNNLWERANTEPNIRHSKLSTHKEITRTWNLKTKYLKDEQVDILAQLAESNEAYLQKIGEYKLTPIIITNKSYDYKYKVNSNSRLISLSITAEEARTRLSI